MNGIDDLVTESLTIERALLKSFDPLCRQDVLLSMDTTQRRVATRSPVALARKALQVAANALPAYSSKYSKKDFTQHQLLAILALEQFFKTDDRGIVVLLDDLGELRSTLGLKKVPHPTTLFQARKRLAKKGALKACCARSSPMLTRQG